MPALLISSDVACGIGRGGDAAGSVTSSFTGTTPGSVTVAGSRAAA